MEPKKNPKFDIHRKRGVIFNFSLAISLMLVIMAFKWSVALRGDPDCRLPTPIEPVELMVVPVVKEKKNEATAPKPKKLVDVKPSVESVNLREVNNSQPVESPSAFIDQNNPPEFEFSELSGDVPEEIGVEVWTFVEKMPEPVGGWETFFKTLIKHMKYPRQATRTNIAGKVFVGFIINEHGVPQDITIIKGIGFGCDEEAMRVIALTKWNPGKQRGIPVKVRMVQPVTFSLGTP